MEYRITTLSNRPCWVVRFMDEATGRERQVSTGVPKERKAAEAHKAAAKLWGELCAGQRSLSPKMGWAEFRQYAETHFVGLKKSPNTAERYRIALGLFESYCSPKTVADLSTVRINGFVEQRKAEGKREATIDSDLRHLKAVARWAVKQGILLKAPAFPPKIAADDAKGRPLQGEEVDRLLAAVPKVVGEAAAPSWEFYLRGLLASGLRLSESLELRWDTGGPGERGSRTPLLRWNGGRPVIYFPPSSHKKAKACTTPCTPDFARLLATVPEGQRRGRVFPLLGKDGTPMTTDRFNVGHAISAMGKRACIVAVREGDLVKYASAHDLRRTFGHHWSRKVMPAVLKELMRHASVATTMKYYVGDDADETSAMLWALEATEPAVGKGASRDHSGDHAPESTGSPHVDDCCISLPANDLSMAEPGLEPGRGLPPTGF